MSKTADDYFRDWESSTFGFGYGSGEPHTLPALAAFLRAIPERPYDYEVLERALTPAVAWLLINALCRVDILEYGTSPRYGWLTATGEALKRYMDVRGMGDLISAVRTTEDYVHCYPDHCNCGGPKCANPFWDDSAARAVLKGPETK